VERAARGSIAAVMRRISSWGGHHRAAAAAEGRRATATQVRRAWILSTAATSPVRRARARRDARICVRVRCRALPI
jgi:hypothetical protein